MRHKIEAPAETRLAPESVNRTASVGDSSLKIDVQFGSV